MASPAVPAPDLRRWTKIWAAFWVAFAVADFLAELRGVSLSKVARFVFRTHTPAGRACFSGVLLGGFAVLWHHIIKGGA